MGTKKYQIFVSSTFRDLADERQDAIRNILDLKHIPAGMELFPAADINQLEYIKKVIDECDYYVLIMGGRYGSLDVDGISFTEREYDYAVSSGKVVLAFVHDDPTSISLAKSDTSPGAIASLNAFREKVMAGRLVIGWTTRSNLEPLVLKSLIHAFNDFPQVGWLRGDQAASEQLLEQANKLMNENAELRQSIQNLKPQNPVMEDVAGMEDVFQVRYKYTTYRRSSGTEHHSSVIDLTWEKIFLNVAAKLDKSRTSRIISEAIGEAIKQETSISTYRSMDDTDLVRIKVQLQALGLISAKVSSTTTGGVEEFLSLTATGQRKFIEGFVVRGSNVAR